MDLYKAHRGPDCATLGLSILPKLKWEHIELNSYSKMRVDLAAKIFMGMDMCDQYDFHRCLALL